MTTSEPIVLRDALRVEIARLPTFDRWPALDDAEFAKRVALEKVQEWDYESDAHGWCHERPIWLTLIAEVERLTDQRDTARSKAALLFEQNTEALRIAKEWQIDPSIVDAFSALDTIRSVLAGDETTETQP